MLRSKTPTVACDLIPLAVLKLFIIFNQGHGNIMSHVTSYRLRY